MDNNAISRITLTPGLPGPYADPKKAVPVENLDQPKDQVEISGNDPKAEEKRPFKDRMARRSRKVFANTVGVINGVTTAIHNVTLGVKEGYNQAVKPGKDLSVRKNELSKLSAINRTITGTAIGALVWGPIGLVLGGITGYVSSSVKIFMDNRSGGMDNLISAVDDRVAAQIDKLPKKEETSKFRKALNGMVAGGIAGMKEGWTRGKHVGRGAGAGILSGTQFIIKDLKENKEFKRTVEPKVKNDDERGVFNKLITRTVGTISGLCGVLMNAPGGVVEGSLHTVEMGVNRKELTRPLLLFATNAGKILPPALVGAAIGGPVGAAVGTAVGLISGSLATIIDGKYGFNRGIVSKVHKAVNEVVEDDSGKGYAIYHSGAKGALVGAYAGVKEGWHLGYKGGVEFMDGLFETPKEAAKTETK